jgi:GDP-4-dehydro-6-deoxy-D-mannose reductase
MRCLVTGGTGFAGAELAELLLARGDEVWAISRTGGAGHLSTGTGASLMTCDVTEPEKVARAVKEISPQAIFHLAARTFVPEAYADGRAFLEANLMGTANLLAAAREHVPGCRVLVVGSAGEYGASGRAGILLAEDAPLRPIDPYGASKAAAELWALQEAAHSELEIICVRPFGHLGPRQDPRFVAADFARQLGRIRAGSRAPRMEVGNLEAVREFNDVADIAAGHLAALERGESGRVYNLCSGRGLRIREVLSLLLERSGVKAEIVQRPERLRPSDVPVLVGDPARARDELSWEVSTPVADTLDRVLARWGALDAH